MAHEPLLSVAVTPEFRTGHVKGAPISPPFGRLIWAIGIAEERQDFLAMLVHILQPVFRCLLIVPAVYFPVFDEFQIGLKLVSVYGRSPWSAHMTKAK